MKTCTTCNKVAGSDHVEFKCPSCGKSTIIRCRHCSDSAKDYTCKECGFAGP